MLILKRHLLQNHVGGNRIFGTVPKTALERTRQAVDLNAPIQCFSARLEIT
jgi:hypothetical protein